MFLPLILGAIAEYAVPVLIGVGISTAVQGAIYLAVIAIDKIREEMRKRKIKKALVKELNSAIGTTLNNTKNSITLKDLDSDCEFTISGDNISDDIYKGQIIYA